MKNLFVFLGVILMTLCAFTSNAQLTISQSLIPPSGVKVGDTITSASNPCDAAIKGFEDVKPMVFAGIYPVETDDYEELRYSMEKLQLNDSSLVFEPESSAALGFGFRCRI
jgi:translation elongation factor EF-4